jgi:CHAT domain-containing protein
VLTPPIRASDADDGLLTASEVAALKLRADWVVLSACNTAAGSEVGADALSGLARAFFFAGAKALLVSHWAVNSDATVALTTGTFRTLAQNPKLGRAEAFRQTMLVMIDAGLAPALWAPFVIVGEGAARD